MLDTSNYSKTATKVIKSQRNLQPRLTSVQEQNGFVWLQHGLSSKQNPTESWWPTTLSVWTAHPSSLEMRSGDCQGSDWPHPSLTAREGMNQLPPLSLGTQELRAEACTAAVRRNQTHPQKPNLYCVIRETDTASQCETDPAPDELGE